MSRFSRTVQLLAVLVGVFALMAPPASAATGDDFFVVDTQFKQAPSTIIDSGGAFAGCTTVTDLGGTAEQIGPNQLLFTGDKRVNCPGGKVTLHYEAELNAASGKRTRGTWTITSSTLEGATSGGGTVRGDSTDCTIEPGSEGCIIDTFAGTTT